MFGSVYLVFVNVYSVFWSVPLFVKVVFLVFGSVFWVFYIIYSVFGIWESVCGGLLVKRCWSEISKVVDSKIYRN